MHRRAFIRTAAGLFVPAIVGRAGVPFQTSDGAFVGRHHAPSNPEPAAPSTDPNIWAYFRSDTGLTYDGSNDIYTSLSGPDTWLDQSGNSRGIRVPSGNSCKRLVAVKNGKDAVSFQIAKTSVGGTPTTTLAQPFTVYLLGRQPSWGEGRFIITDRGLNYSGSIRQTDASPNLVQRSTAVGAQTTDLALNTWGIVTVVFNGGSSLISINKGSDHAGSGGTSGVQGFWFGADANGGSYGDWDHLAIIISASANDSAQRLKHVNWLSWYGGLGL